MKKLINFRILVLLTLLLTTSSLTKGQGESIPDSQYRVIPINTLKYSNFVGIPISLIGDVVVLDIEYPQNPGPIDINGRPVDYSNLALLGVNLKTGKFLFPGGYDSGDVIYNSINPNIFYSSTRSNIIRNQVLQDTIIQKTIFYRKSGYLINTLIEGTGDELFVAHGYSGISLIQGDSIVKEYSLPGISIGTLAKWNNLIVFGGDKGQVGTLDPSNGDIQAISNGAGFFGGVQVYNIHGNLYANGYVKSERGLYKYDSFAKTWNLFTGKNVAFWYDGMIDEWIFQWRAQAPPWKDTSYIFRNDSFIIIPEPEIKSIEYIMSYRDTLAKHYKDNFGSCDYFFNHGGQKYGVGVGMIGTIQKVLIPEDTTDGVSNIGKNQIHLYPNPATNVIKISNLEKETEILVTDLAGRLVLLTQTTDALDISPLAPGLYFLNISGYLPRKFIKE
jgi:hypothetical protein